jgi:hypothetical protein
MTIDQAETVALTAETDRHPRCIRQPAVTVAKPVRFPSVRLAPSLFSAPNALRSKVGRTEIVLIAQTGPIVQSVPNAKCLMQSAIIVVIVAKSPFNPEKADQYCADAALVKSAIRKKPLDLTVDRTPGRNSRNNWMH